MEQLTEEHRIYTGNHLRGTTWIPFGKCSCGAYFHGQEAIDQHREEYCR